LRYRIILSANKDILTVSVPTCIPFIYSSCLIAWARNLRTVLNKRGECGHPSTVPEFGGNGFSFSPLSMMLAIVLSCIVFIMLSYIPSISNFLRAFMMKWC
jgi:hypothetical protein